MSVVFHVVDVLPQNLIAYFQRFTELLRLFFGVRKHLVHYPHNRIGGGVQLALQNFAFRANSFEVCFSGDEWHDPES